MIIDAQTIILNGGYIYVRGTNGGMCSYCTGNHHAGSGGGGSGGAILLRGANLNLGAGWLRAVGGAGNTEGSVGGNGGPGRIRLEYCNTIVQGQTDIGASVEKMAMTCPPPPARTFSVNSARDLDDAFGGDGRCETSSSGECTLRAAVAEARVLPGNHIIELQAGATYPLTLPGDGEERDATGDLDVVYAGGSLTINGHGATINGNHLDRVLHVLPGANLTLNNVTIANGQAPPGSSGGGIYNAGQLTLDSCTVNQNPPAMV